MDSWSWRALSSGGNQERESGRVIDQYGLAHKWLLGVYIFVDSSARKEAKSLQDLAGAFGATTPLSQVTAGSIATWVASMRRAELSDGTIQRRRILLMAVLRRARRVWHAIASVPEVDPLRGGGIKERVLTADEERALLAAAEPDPDVRDLIVVALDTGGRRSELLSLTWGDIDIPGGSMTLHTRKRRKAHEREVPMTMRVVEVLKRRKETGMARPWPWSADSLAAEGGRIGSRGRGGNSRTDPERGIYPRPRADGSTVYDVRLKLSGKLVHVGSWASQVEAMIGRDAHIAKYRPPVPAGLRQRFDRVLERAGLTGSGIGLHALRHSAATRMVAGNIPLKTVAEMLGHASIVTTERYAHTDDTAKRRAVAVLDALNASAASTGRPGARAKTGS